MEPDSPAPQPDTAHTYKTFPQQSIDMAGREGTNVHVVRVAYEDRYPPGTDLHDAVYRDLRRYCSVMGLTFRYEDVWFFAGMRWEMDVDDECFWPTSVRGVRASVETTVLPPDEAERQRKGQLSPPRPIPPSSGGRRHWNDAINGLTRRQRRRLRRQRRKDRQRAGRSIGTDE